MSAVVVDTGVFSAPLIARRAVGQTLQDQYRRHLIGQQLVIATQTLAELHFGAEFASWGATRRSRLGVNTSFRSVTDLDGNEYRVSEKVPVPAAVGDVTGDGWLDLVVTDQGVVSVLAGSGALSGGSYLFDQIGTTTPGWRSEPLRLADLRPTRNLVPFPNASVSLRWDLTGDDVDDYVAESTVDRSSGPIVFYAGARCSTR